MSLAVIYAAPKDRRLRAGGHGFRAPNEFYPTPPEAARALLSVESFDGDIWEPACGDGAISEVLVGAGYDVVSTDLIAYGYGEAGVDFLTQTKARAKHIVTNPPYAPALPTPSCAMRLSWSLLPAAAWPCSSTSRRYATGCATIGT